MIITLFVVFFHVVLQAQIEPSIKPSVRLKNIISEWEIGIGPTFSEPITNDIVKKNTRIKSGVMVGLGSIHRFNDRFELNVKGIYETKGLRSVLHTLNYEYNPPAQQRDEIEITLSYATLSLLPRYYPVKGVDFFVGGGPYIGYLLSEKIDSEIRIDGTLIMNRTTRVDPSSYKQVDFGFTGCVGQKIRLSERMIGTVQGLYCIGLHKANRSVTGDFRNSSFELQLGVTFKRKTN